MKKRWAKMMLNSSYGFPPKPFISHFYDKDGEQKITSESKKNLELIQKFLNKC